LYREKWESRIFMKNIQTFWVQGSTTIRQGMGNKITLALTGALSLLLLMPLTIKAGEAITQLQYIQWLVHVTGEGGKFTASSGVADYVQWAQSKGMTPAGGWQPTATLSREVLAQTLVQLFNLSSSQKNADYERILQREGIPLPDASQITRGNLVTILDWSVPTRFPGAGSPVRRPNNGLGNGEQPPPPNNPNGDPHVNPPGKSGITPGHNK
jgi:hypothetical protein